MPLLVSTTAAPDTWEFGVLDFEPFGAEVAQAIQSSFASTGEGEDRVTTELGKLRNALGNLVHGTATSREKKLAVLAIDFFTAEHAKVAPDAIQSFLGADAVSRMYQTDDTALRKIVSWWNDEHGKFQAGLDEALPDLQREAIAASERLADAGLLTLMGVQRLRKSVLAHTVRPMDPFMRGAHNASGLYLLSDRQIGLANLFIDARQYSGVSTELTEAYLHEIIHGAGVLGAVGYWQVPGGGGMLPEEAAVSHQCNVAFSDDPQPYIMRPSERTNDDGVYTSERELLGLAGVDASRLVRSYYEGAESHNRQHVHAALANLVLHRIPGQASAAALLAAYDGASGFARHELATTWVRVASSSNKAEQA